jgi:hypothetical protein
MPPLRTRGSLRADWDCRYVVEIADDHPLMWVSGSRFYYVKAVLDEVFAFLRLL